MRILLLLAVLLSERVNNPVRFSVLNRKPIDSAGFIVTNLRNIEPVIALVSLNRTITRTNPDERCSVQFTANRLLIYLNSHMN